MSNGEISEPRGYNQYLDVLKGFAIILVVLGHALQYHLAYQHNLLFRVIYSVHMPLFIFLSGAIAAYGRQPQNWRFLERKARQLVVPFAAWGFIEHYIKGVCFDGFLPRYMNRLFAHPDNGFWFLWVLFLCFCALYMAHRLHLFIGKWAYALIWLTVVMVPISAYGVGLLRWYIPFFFAGYLLHAYPPRRAVYQQVLLGLSCVLFPLLAVRWQWLGLPNEIIALREWLLHLGILNVSLGDVARLNVYQAIVTIYMYLVPFAGIGFVFVVFRQKFLKHTYRYFRFLGGYTLEIYILSWYFVRHQFNGNPYVVITLSTAGSITFAVLLGRFVFRRISLLNTIFMGGRSKVKTSIPNA